MTVRSKSEMTVASSMDASGSRRAQKSAIRCKQPNAKTKRLSKVEKRRLAALAGWEKRRSKRDDKMEGCTTVVKKKVASFQSAATAASASSWERRRRKVSTTDAEDDDAASRPLSRARRRKNMIASKVVEESVSSSEEEAEDKEEESDLNDETSKKPLSRSEAARLGWARRRKMLAAAEAESEEESVEEEEEEEEEDDDETSKKPLSRSEAARLGWARRRKMLAAAEAESEEESDEEEEEEEEEDDDETSKKPLSRSEAARLGWARRRKMLAAAEAESEEESDEDEEAEEETSKKPLSRSEAARLGWARRRKMLAAAEAESEEESDEEEEEEEEEEDQPLDRAAAARLGWARRRKMLAAKEAERKRDVSRSKKAPRRTRGYSAAARRNAAKRGWERRKLTLSGANSDISDEGVCTAEDGAYSVQASGDNISTTDKVTASATIKETKRIPSWLKSKPREGAKRSRRLAEDSTDSHEETARKMNELVSFLKTTRGWMEFHPSSRHGSGTATYGYIPASIASFIRGGTVSKSVVLDHGTLGVHYALDYEGYGGLKEMIDIFGIDYSPYPTEKMLEVSREVLGKRNIQVSAWDLGEDLPWQEVEQAEEKKIDLLFVANILASLNDAGNACSNKEHQDDKDQNTDLLCSQLPNISRSNSTDATSSVEDDSIQGKLVDKDVLFIQSQSVFSQWSFGIC